MEKEQADQQFLTCEKKWIFYILICIAGYFGAYTYVLRGNIFCNAQTGNIVLMGIAFGSGDFSEGVYYL
ncbi:MAG: YoaK family protein, partial [Merdibacter sp.]|nr:YoaK family protein [Merdibacter sp.]